MVFVTPVVEHWLDRGDGSAIRDQSDDPSHHEQAICYGAMLKDFFPSLLQFNFFLIHKLPPQTYLCNITKH